jgi:capsular polysaccharide biosynthesis protein
MSNASTPYPTANYDNHVPKNDDEISLYDIVTILIRRRWVVVGTTVAIFILACLYGLLQEPLYRYSLLIEIESIPSEYTLRLIESSESVVERLNVVHIPAVVREWEAEWQTGKTAPKVKATAARRGSIVTISGRGSADRESDYFYVLNGASQRLRQDHDRLLGTFEEELLSLMSQKTMLSEHSKRLTQEMVEIEAWLASYEDDLKSESMKEDSESAALMRMILSNEIRARRERLNLIKEQIYVTLPTMQLELAAQIANKQRMITVQQPVVGSTELGEIDIVKTTSPPKPQKSAHPVSRRPLEYSVLGLILGFLAGIFMVFLVEFVVNARKRWRESQK